MKRLLALLLAMMLLVTACQGGEAPAAETPSEPAQTEQGSDAPAEEPAEPTETDQGLKYAEKQEFNGVYSGEVTTLNYLVTATTAEFGLAANFVDTLIDYDRYGVLIPSLAESWSVSDDGLTWTFKLREGVMWYTHDGEEYAETVAEDFVSAAKYLFNPDNGSKTANIAYRVLKNAEAYYNGEITDFEEVGVKAVDKYTLEYTLKNPVPYFESMLAYSCFFPVNGDFIAEKGDAFGTAKENLLYNGAYILDEFEPQNRRVLVKNENYWDKDMVYIEKIKYKYNKEAGTIGQELFLRGEISSVEIPSTSIDAWMQDDTLKEMVRPDRNSFYTYFYALNFDPQYDDAYDPENWKIAVNNLNFRKAFFHGLDRIAAMTTKEPYSPANKLANTVTPPSFVNYAGKDFTMMEGLAAFSTSDSFNESMAQDYKAKAMAELEGTVEFPVKVVLPYSTGTTENAQRAQVVEQQLERTLGEDFIDVYIVPYPPSGFLNNTRRSGNYSFQDVNWGPDYADPETYTDMFVPGSNYNFPELSTEVDENGNLKYDVYMGLVEEAMAEVVDIEKRYALFAQAESYLIDQAWVVPFGLGGGGYISSLLDPFESPYSPFGVSSQRYKGQHVLEKPMNTEDYLQAKADWEAERAKRMAE